LQDQVNKLVSPTYAEEISKHRNFGEEFLDGVLRPKQSISLSESLNGIGDYD